MLFLFAQAAGTATVNPDIPAWLTAGGVGTSVAFTIWLAWHLVSKVGPEREKRSEERLDAKEASHRAERDRDRQEWQKAVESMSARHEAVATKIMEHCAEESQWLRQVKGLPSG